MKAMVIYSSQTGNTQKVAAGIFSGIPGENKDIQEIGAYSGTDADIFFVGFGRIGETATNLLQRSFLDFRTKGWFCLEHVEWEEMPSIIKG